jgi:hypothetical protein
VIPIVSTSGTQKQVYSYFFIILKLTPEVHGTCGPWMNRVDSVG